MRLDCLSISWNVGGMAVTFLPLIFFTVARTSLEYNKNQDQQDDNNNNNNQQQQNSWFQSWGRNNNNNNQADNNNFQAPWWCKYERKIWLMRLLILEKHSLLVFVHSFCVWMFPVGGRRQEQGNDEDRSPDGVLIFVYLWTTSLFILMVLYGNRMLAQKPIPSKLQWALLGFGNVSFIVCLLIGNLQVIKVDGRELEQTGWYGQTSVLLFLTCLFGTAYSILFSLWIRKRLKAQAKVENQIPAYYLHEKTDFATTEQPQRHLSLV